MNINTINSLLRSGIWEVFKLAAPVLGAALIIGLIVALVQAITQIQEQTLTFLPKLFIILLVLALLGGWMISDMGNWTINLFKSIPKIA